MDRINEDYSIIEPWTTISVIFRLSLLYIQDVFYKFRSIGSSLCENYAEDIM